MVWLGGVLLAGVAGLLVLARIVGALWTRETAARLSDISYGAMAPRPEPRTETADLEELPDPVQRFFRVSLSRDHPSILEAHIRQRGVFRAEPGRPWSPMVAEQYFRTAPPGFVWDARIRMSGVLQVRVRDSYGRSGGEMKGKVFGLFPVVDATGEAALSQAALQRYLAEAAWLPTALLPGSGVEWSPLSDRSARATIRDGDVVASLDFLFSEAGQIEAVRANRYREEDGRYELRPWEGRFWNHADNHGLRIPMDAEVSWLLGQERFVYWRGSLTDVTYRYGSLSAASAILH